MSLISLCAPVMNRMDDLRQALPTWIGAALESWPVEIAVLDYNSRDGLQEFLDGFQDVVYYSRYTGREHYHVAHAYNLAVKCSHGDIVVVMGADALLHERYVATVRELFERGAVWARGRHYKGIVAVRRDEFEAAGGYDERCEFYSGEDKEFEDRMLRRGHCPALVPDGMVSVIRTPNGKKLDNYRLPLSKAEMMGMGAMIRAENARNRMLVANEGREWGAW